MAMHYSEIKNALNSETSIRLLRSTNAPLVLAVFFQFFKKDGNLTIPFTTFVTKLNYFLEELPAEERELYPRMAEDYISSWCDENSRLMRKYYLTDRDDPVLELTAGSEKVLNWIEELNTKRFVATESRLLNIFNGLKELAEKNFQTPSQAIKRLQLKRKEIDREIKELQATGHSANKLTSTQVKERLFYLIDESRRLPSDFKQVEQNFKDIARGLKEEMMSERAKGELLGETLNAHDYIENEDQGKSFNTFCRFLMSPSKQQEFQELIDKIRSLDEIEQLIEETDEQNHFIPLFKLKSNLLKATEKVNQSNHLLGSQFKRLLSNKISGEDKRVSALMDEILANFVCHKDRIKAKDHCISLLGTPEIKLPFERPLWSPKARESFNNTPLKAAKDEVSEILLQQLLDTNHINIDTLKNNINQMLLDNDSVELEQVLDRFNLPRGLGELVGYLQIASTSSSAEILPTQLEKRSYGSTKKQSLLEYPRCTFWRTKREKKDE